jgi:hypothetical protein
MRPVWFSIAAMWFVFGLTIDPSFFFPAISFFVLALIS